MNTIQCSLVTFVSLSLLSCGGGGNSTATRPVEPEPAIAAVLSAEEPTGAVSVSEARKSAKPGDAITVAGIVAGAAKPFTEGYASLVLGDAAMETCDKIPEDECPTPWDACCADPDELKGMRLTLQVLGADGTPVAQSLKGISGLAEMDALVASGTVSADSTAENLVVNVTKLHRKAKP